MTVNHDHDRANPGELSDRRRVRRMIRVDQAGEYGAARIYDGQLRILGENHRLTPVIRQMADQEARHLETFDELIRARQARPTLLGPLWNAAGFALGAVTALMGERALMACTAAVEEVIDDHYEKQKQSLERMPGQASLRRVVGEFQADEAEHRQTALDNGAEDTPGYELLSGAIKAGCRAAIWLSTRI